jgi:hypothetical protein
MHDSASCRFCATGVDLTTDPPRCGCDGEMMDILQRTLKKMIEMLMKLEFSHSSRYGDNCPICGGLEHGGVDSEAGPDRGHEEGCDLRALLDEIEGYREDA